MEDIKPSTPSISPLRASSSDSDPAESRFSDLCKVLVDMVPSFISFTSVQLCMHLCPKVGLINYDALKLCLLILLCQLMFYYRVHWNWMITLGRRL